MTIYYYPHPLAQPAPATVAADSYFGSRDVYVNQNGAVRVGNLGSGLSAGKIVLANYDTTKPFIGETGNLFPGLGSPPTPPQIIASTVVASQAAIAGSTLSFNAVTAYGGSGISGSVLNVAISPSLPTGLSLQTNKVFCTLSTSAPTVSGSGTSWSVTYTIDSRDGDLPVVGNFYSVRGQTKTSYNGIWECTAVTANTITLLYNADPSLSGGSTPPGQISWNSSVVTTLSDDTVKSFTANNGVTYWYNNIDVYIRGTPTVSSNTTTYTVTFTDAIGQTSSANFELGIAPNPSALTSTVNVASRSLIQNQLITPFVPVTANGGDAPLTYSISPSLPTGVNFNTSTGEISGTPTTSSIEIIYTITITDVNGSTTSKTFSLTVIAPPVTATTVISSRVLTSGVTFTPFTPVNAVGGIAPLIFTVNPNLPANLTFSTSTGQIAGTATNAIAQTNFTVQVSDSNTPARTSSTVFSLTVNPLPVLNSTLNITTSTFTKNVTISPITPVSGSGGFGTLTYQIVPALPSGLSFSQTTGQITGTPSASSTLSSYTVNISDQANQTTSKDFFVEVLPAVLSSTLVISNRTLIKNAVTTPFTPVTASGGEGTLVFSINPGLPTGLNLNTGTGQISGTPTLTSSATVYTITIEDDLDQSTSQNFSLTVNDPPLLTSVDIGTKTIVQGENIVPFTPVIASGGFGTLTYQIVPALPSGLNYNLTNGVVSGNSSVYDITGTTYTVVIADQAAQTSTQTWILVIETPPLQINETVPSSILIRSVPVSSFTPVTASGGSLIYTYNLNPALPSGLSYNTSTGQITGTPTVTQNETVYTVSVEDSLGESNTGTFRLTINDPPALTTTLTTSTATFYRITDAINFTPVTANGGYGNITFSITPSVPSGLSFSSNNGRITGTASQLSNQLHTVIATDSIGQTSSKQFRLILLNPPVETEVLIPTRTETRSKPVTSFKPINAQGGIAPLNYSISPSLPANLALDVQTGNISGTALTTLSTTTFTITVTDNVGSSSGKSFDLNVIEPVAITITTSTATLVFVRNQSVTPVIPIQGDNGEGILTYSISPSLVNGLQFDSSLGRISGTPVSLSSPVEYFVTVADEINQTNTGSFTLSIISPPLIAVVNNSTLVFSQYTQISTVIPVLGTGGTSPLIYSINPALPIGLTYNTSTGQLTGTPSVVSSATAYTITITDSAAITTSSTILITVNDAAPPQLTASAQNSSVSLEINEETNFRPINGAGGIGTYTYTISSSLPSGLSFNQATGFITGTPTQLSGSVSYTVIITDEVPQNASASFNLSVIQTPVSADKGYTGSRGFAGSQGNIGFTGSQGEVGFVGSQGDIGFTGSQGEVGFVGSQGEVGFVGSQGDIGFTGSLGFTGSQGDNGFVGSQGDIGFTGSLGFTGSTGSGFTGSQGETGFVGSQGDNGFVGSQGDIGFTGSQGDIGFVGSQGDIGFVGSQGDNGFVGSQGETGFVGSQGDIGFVGSQGDIGFVGSQGDIGFTGSRGSDGTSVQIVGSVANEVDLPDPYNGNIGDGYIIESTGNLWIWDGAAWVDVGLIRGPQGPQGEQGLQGDPGYTGSIGYSGSKGDSGFIGSVGYTGSGGVTSFISLTDVPQSYTGNAEKFVRVNSSATGLEFVTGGISGGSYNVDGGEPGSVYGGIPPLDAGGVT